MVEVFTALQYSREIYGKTVVWFLVELNLRTKNLSGNYVSQNFWVHAHIIQVFENVAANCKKSAPAYSLTTGEQLMPMKNRCPFTVYMFNKPDKFVTKF